MFSSLHTVCNSFLIMGKLSHTLALLQHQVPPTGDSPPPNFSPWVLPTSCSSSQTVPAWIPSMRSSLSGADSSRASASWGHKFCQQTCSSVVPSLSGATDPAVSLSFKHRLQNRVEDSFAHPLAPSWGCPQAAGGSLSTMNIHGLQGHSFFTMGFTSVCRGISAPGLEHLLSFFTDFGVCA